MDLGLLLLLAIVSLWIAAVAAAIGGTVDTFQFGPEVWAEAGYQRTSWMWQAALIPVLPVALVYSGVYQFRVRPRLRAAEREIATADPGYCAWVARQRWYDRFTPARRSPYKWEKAARRWWLWIPTVIVAELVAAFYLATAAGNHRDGMGRFGYVPAGIWALLGLISAVRTGFWYGEHMRLTGRRPARGGRLRSPASNASSEHGTIVRGKRRWDPGT